MKTNEDTPSVPGKPVPTVACTVRVTGTTVGNAILAAGAKIRLPKDSADTLASMTPPRVEITGI